MYDTIKCKHCNSYGQYWLDRNGAPRGYVYISSDPDGNLWLNNIQGPAIELKHEFNGTFYKVSDDPVYEGGSYYTY